MALTAAVVASAAPAVAATPSRFAGARVEGQFSMEARITVAKNVTREHVGERLGRTWTFHPLCASGACAQVQLVRNRAGGADVLTLSQTTPGSYAGNGLFYAPLACAGKTYARGESVPFRITVTITAESTAGIATAVKATYVNRSRRNLTRCVDIPGHDAATYTGRLAPATTGGTGA
ncbi:MAG TPA: hypothetical protein VG410_01900 [Solirubrobacteraceae bacterium]|nr:hypothetical protein [Solirubrobacteraceae bacterium]